MVWYSLLPSFIFKRASSSYRQLSQIFSDSAVCIFTREREETQWQRVELGGRSDDWICNKYPWELRSRENWEIACTLHSSTQLVKTNSFCFYLVEITTTSELDIWYMICDTFSHIPQNKYSLFYHLSPQHPSWKLAVRDCSSRLRWMCGLWVHWTYNWSQPARIWLGIICYIFDWNLWFGHLVMIFDLWSLQYEPLNYRNIISLDCFVQTVNLWNFRSVSQEIVLVRSERERLYDDNGSLPGLSMFHTFLPVWMVKQIEQLPQHGKLLLPRWPSSTTVLSQSWMFPASGYRVATYSTFFPASNEHHWIRIKVYLRMRGEVWAAGGGVVSDLRSLL